VTLLALGQSMNAVADVYSPAGKPHRRLHKQLHRPNKPGQQPDLHDSSSCRRPRFHRRLRNLVVFLTGRCGAALLSGPPVTNAVTLFAEMDSYTFTGNPGETVAINAVGSNFTAAAFVAGPNGAIIANWVNGVATLDLASTGTYTVGVYSFYVAGTGTYSLSLFYAKLVPASYRLAIGATNSAAALTIWGQAGRQRPSGMPRTWPPQFNGSR